MTNQTHHILYSFRRCPYAMRARLAIMASGFKVELREVVLRDKPQAMLDISPKGTVPVLQLADSEIIEESLDVMRHCLTINDPLNWGQGQDDLSQDLLHDLQGFFIPHLNKYKYAKRYDEEIDPMVHRSEAEKYLRRLDGVITNSGGGLISTTDRYADMAIFPFIRQFYMVDPKWFESENWEALTAWLKAKLDGDLFKSIMSKYLQWHEGDEPTFFAG